MILVFGSINIDVVVPVPVLPRPGETVLGADYALLPGGKGANQALAARRAGTDVTMAGAVGNDAFAGLAVENLRRDGVDLGLVRRVERPTGCAAIMVGEGGENLIAVAPGANCEACASMVPEATLGPEGVLVCQMEVPVSENWGLIRRARAAGARTILNLAPATKLDPALFGEIDLLIVNRGEAAMLEAAPTEVGGRLRQALVVTRGPEGATAFLPGGGRIDVPALTIEPVDTTGAGDTFVGVLAAGVDAGLALAPAAPLDPELFPSIDLLVANRGEAASLAADPASIAVDCGPHWSSRAAPRGLPPISPMGSGSIFRRLRSSRWTRRGRETPSSGCSRPGSTVVYRSRPHCSARALRRG
jgi:ribokinase